MYQVVGCSNTKDAVEVVKTQEIHIVLLDAVMMEMDGYEMLESILGKNNIPVVLMCENKCKDFLQKAEGMRVHDYLMKPFPHLQLNEIIHSILEN